MRFFLFIFLGLLVADIVCWHGLDRVLRQASAPQIARFVLAAFILFQFGSLLAIVGSRIFSIPSLPWLGKSGLSLIFIWHLLIAPWLALLLPVQGWWARSHATPPRGAGDVNAPSLSRREFLGITGAALGPALAVLLTGAALRQLNGFRVRRLTVNVPDLPPALEGLTIAHVSDLHVGQLSNEKVLDSITATTNALNPDLIFVTGDIINYDLRDLPRALQIIAAMKSRYGTYLCEGNHDLIEDAAAFEALTRLSGLPILLDQAQIIDVNGQPVQLFGLRWYGGDGATMAPYLERLLALRQEPAFPILLAHHPHAFDAAVEHGLPLTFAGHTHGGQLMLTDTIGCGPMMFRYWSGLYEKGKSRLIVSNGTGNWFPLRINAPAEIIHVTLKKA